jgi:hypothetical protein
MDELTQDQIDQIVQEAVIRRIKDFQEPEWQCHYCKRVNEFSHKTCDGCGASKDIQDTYYAKQPYSNLEPVFLTTGHETAMARQRETMIELDPNIANDAWK